MAAIAGIQSADSLESLYEKYGSYVREHPEIAWYLKKQYLTRKGNIMPE